ncbi:sensor domain-containing diguanylate cyclase [Aliidiomarina sedimenti]|nr:GGDEF domain-containing protein [Aliidiomarina sedimenti]
MPFLVILPLLGWLAVSVIPPLFTVAEPVINALASSWVIWLSLSAVAALAGLMRQWSWWYWLGLVASVFFVSQRVLGEALTEDGVAVLQVFLPLLMVALVLLLSLLPKPPLWRPLGLTLLAVVVGLPLLLLLLPLAGVQHWWGFNLFAARPLVAGLSLSWPLLLFSLLVVGVWFIPRAKRSGQPREWTELAVTLLLLLMLLTTQQPLLMNLAAFAMALTLLLGLTTQMLNLAYVDELTQLPARRALMNEMRKLGRRSAVTMLDVDHFKKFNDTYGHDVGDQVLRLIAAQLRKEPGCKAFRYGGEEFTLIFSHADKEEITQRLESVRQRVANYPLRLRSQRRPVSGKKGQQKRGGGAGKVKTVKVTISLGCAIRRLGESTDAMLKRADSILYKAKNAGRNCALVSL